MTYSEPPVAFASSDCLRAFDRMLIGKELTPEQTKFAWEWFERGCLFRALPSVPPHTPATAEQVCDHPFPCLAGAAQTCSFPQCNCPEAAGVKREDSGVEINARKVSE